MKSEIYILTSVAGSYMYRTFKYDLTVTQLDFKT